jgi:hypothetical protein
MPEEYQKLDDKIKELNSTRVYKKITPLYTKDWYIKWVASAVILVAVMCRSAPDVPKIFDLVLSFIGCTGWLTVGMIWHDRALIFLNSILLFVLGTGILSYIVRM